VVHLPNRGVLYSLRLRLEYASILRRKIADDLQVRYSSVRMFLEDGSEIDNDYVLLHEYGLHDRSIITVEIESGKRKQPLALAAPPIASTIPSTSNTITTTSIPSPLKSIAATTTTTAAATTTATTNLSASTTKPITSSTASTTPSDAPVQLMESLCQNDIEIPHMDWSWLVPTSQLAYTGNTTEVANDCLNTTVEPTWHTQSLAHQPWPTRTLRF
jgi:hypothetical protein